MRLICTLDPESKSPPQVQLPEAAVIGNYVAVRDQGDNAELLELTSLVEVALGGEQGCGDIDVPRSGRDRRLFLKLSVLVRACSLPMVQRTKSSR